jgi:hypothetical protein
VEPDRDRLGCFLSVSPRSWTGRGLYWISDVRAFVHVPPTMNGIGHVFCILWIHASTARTRHLALPGFFFSSFCCLFRRRPAPWMYQSVVSGEEMLCTHCFAHRATARRVIRSEGGRTYAIVKLDTSALFDHRWMDGYWGTAPACAVADCLCCRAEQSRAEQSRAEQSRAEQMESKSVYSDESVVICGGMGRGESSTPHIHVRHQRIIFRTNQRQQPPMQVMQCHTYNAMTMPHNSYALSMPRNTTRHPQNLCKTS